MRLMIDLQALSGLSLCRKRYTEQQPETKSTAFHSEAGHRGRVDAPIINCA